MTGILAAIAISPLFFDSTHEVRSSYQSFGKILEDRPMQVSEIKIGCRTESFGRFAIRGRSVSSLTDRRSDAHRHAFYHTEFGPAWQYDAEIAENWILKSDVTHSWTLYRGFRHGNGDRSYTWVQIDQSLENPYVTPFGRIRGYYQGSDYLYFKAGIRKRLEFSDGFYFTPSVYAEGGSGRLQTRNFGKRADGGKLADGISAVSGRLELGWRINANLTAFGYIEQSGVAGGEVRRANAKTPYRCAHNDWTHGGVGIRVKF